MKHNTSTSPKKPIPTPRRTDSQTTHDSVGVPVPIPRSASEDEEGYQLMASMTITQNASQQDLDDASGYTTVNTTSSDTTVLRQLNSEIDLLQNVLELPSLDVVPTSNVYEIPSSYRPSPLATPTTPTRATVKKSISNNEGGGVARRNTPKGRKDLRRGVVTDVGQKQEDDYIAMSPTNSLLLSWSSGTPPKTAPPSNGAEPPRSNYYLEILPDDETQLNKGSSSSVAAQKPIQLSPTQQNKPKPHLHPAPKFKAPSPPTDKTRLSPSAPPDNQYIDMKHPQTKATREQRNENESRVHLRPRKHKDKQQQQGQGNGWKRSQGSIFAQEMINIMSEKEASYQPVPVFHNKHSNARPLMQDQQGEEPTPPQIPARPPQTYIREADSSDEEPSSDYYAPVHPPDSIANRMKDVSDNTLTPPGLPPKSKSLLREQGIDTPPQSPTPYLKPIKSKSEKKRSLVTSNVVSSPLEASVEKSSKSGLKAKDVIRALRKQALEPDSTPQKPKKRASPEISAPRIPLALPTKRWDGFQDKVDALSSDDDYVDSNGASEFSSLDKLVLERSHSTPNLLDDYTTMRGHAYATPTLSGTSLDTKSVSEDVPLPVATASLTSETAISSPVVDPSLTASSDDFCFQWKRKGVQRRKKGRCDQIKKINRNSLALILQNHALISKQLEEYSLTSGSRGNSVGSVRDEGGVDQTPPPKKGRETLLRSLGEILLEVNEVLRDVNADEEDDIITAIEKQFKFKLRKLPSQDKGTASVPSWHDQGEEIEVELTDRDVQLVVEYVHTNCEGCTPPDPPGPPSETHRGEEPVSKPKEISRFAPLRRSVSDAALLKSSRDFYEDFISPTSLSPPSFTQSMATAELKLSNFKKNKRRVTATASDLIMTTSSSNSGVGYFTHKGGTLSNTNTSVIVEIPEGAVPKGRRQKIM